MKNWKRSGTGVMFFGKKKQVKRVKKVLFFMFCWPFSLGPSPKILFDPGF